MKLNAQNIDTDVPMGWVVVRGYGLETTTGGANEEKQRNFR
ncbi:hypothetical protein [Cellulophaga sp. F20128]|nr:hypothetical protein [Cellulophaga sp. F20128]